MAISPLTIGSRGDTVYHMAIQAAIAIRDGKMERIKAEKDLREIATVSGLDAYEAEKTIKSGLDVFA